MIGSTAVEPTTLIWLLATEMLVAFSPTRSTEHPRISFLPLLEPWMKYVGVIYPCNRCLKRHRRARPADIVRL